MQGDLTRLGSCKTKAALVWGLEPCTRLSTPCSNQLCVTVCRVELTGSGRPRGAMIITHVVGVRVPADGRQPYVDLVAVALKLDLEHRVAVVVRQTRDPALGARLEAAILAGVGDEGEDNVADVVATRYGLRRVDEWRTLGRQRRSRHTMSAWWERCRGGRRALATEQARARAEPRGGCE